MSDWSQPAAVIPDSEGCTPYKPAICDYNGRVFLAWATQSDSELQFPRNFHFTSRNLADDGWAQPSLVSLDSEQGEGYQTASSALVVFNHILYAFVPVRYRAGENNEVISGLAIFQYNGSTFNRTVWWQTHLSSYVAAVVCGGTLHVIQALRSPSEETPNSIRWNYSLPGVQTITSSDQFSQDALLGEYTSSTPTLMVRDGEVVALFLTNDDHRQVFETTLDWSTKTWNISHRLSQWGNSGISAMTTPNNDT
ncbi:hypothetical protein F5Y16DRAFT_403834 [Xylariaceae sp. FL0255]|nr:hypothetical protein F5Y16DRAFT_403834 [Xylariaceae sp. FL0255]